MEISREFYRHLAVTPCQGLSVGIDDFPQLAEVGVGHATDGAFDDRRLDRTPRLEYMTGFANRGLRHIGAPVGPEFEPAAEVKLAAKPARSMNVYEGGEPTVSWACEVYDGVWGVAGPQAYDAFMRSLEPV